MSWTDVYAWYIQKCMQINRTHKRDNSVVRIHNKHKLMIRQTEFNVVRGPNVY